MKHFNEYLPASPTRRNRHFCEFTIDEMILMEQINRKRGGRHIVDKFAIKHLAPAFGFSEKDLEALREKGNSDDKEVGEKPFKKVVSKMNDVQESIMQSVKGTLS